MLYWNGNLSNIRAEALRTLRLEGDRHLNGKHADSDNGN